MGKLKGAAKRRRDLSQPGGRCGGRVQPPISRVKGVYLWFLERKKWISVGLDHDLCIYIFMSSVIMYIFKGSVFMKVFHFFKNTYAAAT